MKHIPDSLWSELEKLIPQKIGGVGRPEFSARKALEGIIYVLHTGCQWNMMPEKYGHCSTVHGKFIKWCKLGVFKKIIRRARCYYQSRNSKNNWYAFDTIFRKAPFARFGGKNPTDRGKRGIKHAILIDRKGAPLFVDIAAANRHDSKLLEPIIAQLKKYKKIKILAADSAFDVKKLREICKTKNIALIASTNSRRKKNVEKVYPVYRWKIEQSLGITSWSRGIKICWNKTKESALAFLQLACSIRLFKMAGIFG